MSNALMAPRKNRRSEAMRHTDKEREQRLMEANKNNSKVKK